MNDGMENNLPKLAKKLTKQLDMSAVLLACTNDDYTDFGFCGNAFQHVEIVLQMLSFMSKGEKELLQDLAEKGERELVDAIYKLADIVDKNLANIDNWNMTDPVYLKNMIIKKEQTNGINSI